MSFIWEDGYGLLRLRCSIPTLQRFMPKSPRWEVAGSIMLLCGLSIIACGRVIAGRILRVGWFWYVGTLIPVIGLVQVGIQAYADRYTYVPMIGILITLAWGIPELLAGWRFRRLALVVSGSAVVLVLSGLPGVR